MARFREEAGPGYGRDGGIGGVDAPAELAEKHVVWGLVLGVELHAHALEVLHRVRLAIFERFGENIADRVAVDGQLAVSVPVGEEWLADALAGFGEDATGARTAATASLSWLRGRQGTTGGIDLLAHVNGPEAPVLDDARRC